MKSSYLAAAIIVVLAGAWMLSGWLVPGKPRGMAAEETVREQNSRSERISRVRVRNSEAKPVFNDVVVTGRSQASRTVELRAETAGQVDAVFFREGAQVKTGDVLVTLEIRDREKRVEEARAAVRQREIEYNAASELETKGFNTRIRLAEAKTSLQTALANLRQVEIDLGKTKIIAPFDGILSQQMVELGDFVAVGSPLYKIVDLDPVEFVGYVTERSIIDVRVGLPARVMFTGGAEAEGNVSFVAPAADPMTRTFRTVVSVSNPAHYIKDGMTAEIRIPLSGTKAHHISPSVLSLDDKGQVGVKIVNDENRVEFIPVKIIADRPDHMLVDGLPEKARIISVGQEFVIPGQQVEPVASEREGLL